jgi:hypothetical protein
MFIMTNSYNKTENRRNFYADRFTSQDGRCAICRRKERLVIDHDHSTGAMRGLLCYKHNAALGMFEDSPELMKAAVEYLLNTNSHKHPDLREENELYKLTEILLNELHHSSDRARAKQLAKLADLSLYAAQSRISRARRKRKTREKAKMPHITDSLCDSRITPL